MPGTDRPRIGHGSDPDQGTSGSGDAGRSGSCTAGLPPGPALRENAPVEAVSAREAEVLAAVGAGLTNAEISRTLHISVRTVESHVSALLRKLGAADRRALALLAVQPASPPTAVAAGPEADVVGRGGDDHAVRALLTEARLVTIVAAGGSGKTTLARAVAAGQRSAFVDLVTLPAGSAADLVLGAVASALGVAESGDQSLLASVHLMLAAAPTLVVLDNCEHLLDGAAAVAAQLLALPEAHLLATSRERLSVPGETVHRLDPLPLADAVELFTRRARQADPGVVCDPSVVEGVCRRLDCLPLAIELAAARLAVFDLDDLVARLDQSLDILDGGDRTNPRHRSVRDALNWSHDLLAADEQLVHRRLAVLAGPSSLATIEAVVGVGPSVVSSVARLCEASLLQRNGKQYRQLDLVHDDARARLVASGERAGAVERLLAWAQATLGDGPVVGDHIAAFEAALQDDHRGLNEYTAALVDSLCDEGRWTEAVAVRVRQADTSGDARPARLAAEIALGQWRGGDGERLLRHAIALADRAGDRREAAIAASTIAEMHGRFGGMMPTRLTDDDLGVLAGIVVDVAADAPDDVELRARVLLAQAATRTPRTTEFTPIARAEIERLHAAGLDIALVSALYDSSLVGRPFFEARADLEVCVAREKACSGLHGHGRPLLELGDLVAMLASTHLRCGNLDEALVWARRAQTVDLRNDTRWGLGQESETLFRMGDFDAMLTSVERVRRSLEAHPSLTSAYFTSTFAQAALVCGYRQDDDAAAVWMERARAVLSSDGFHQVIDQLWADVLLHRGDRDGAAAVLTVDIDDVHYTERSFFAAIRAEALGGDAIAAARVWASEDRYAAGILARAEGNFDEAIAIFTEIGARYQLARTQVLAGPQHEAAGRAGYAALAIPLD